MRTFTRRFRTDTGMSPAPWLLRQRVEKARRLLETTDLPVDRVAERAGFGTPTAMRQQPRAVVGVSPTAYRRTFGRPSLGNPEQPRLRLSTRPHLGPDRSPA